MRHDDRIGEARLALRFLEAVAVALEVAELGQIDPVVLAVVEEHREPLLGREPHVMAAVRADVEVRLKLAMEDHLPAFGAFMPKLVRNLGLLHEGADAGPHEIGEPVHEAALALALAPRTPALSRRTKARASGTSAGLARPAASSPLAITSTRAEPTTAASAKRAKPAASSG